MTWPAGRRPAQRGLRPQPQLGKPPPIERGRWRLTLHERQFAQALSYQDTIITEISGARSRQLSQEYNKAATFTFALNGTSAAARLVKELMTDVVAWRWDEQQAV